MDTNHFTDDILLENLSFDKFKAEVLKDLPSLDRKFFHVELDPKMNKAYALNPNRSPGGFGCAAMKSTTDLLRLSSSAT